MFMSSPTYLHFAAATAMRYKAGRVIILQLSFFLAASILRPLQAEQCRPDDAKPCVANCNGTTFDLSSVKDLPYVPLSTRCLESLITGIQ